MEPALSRSTAALLRSQAMTCAAAGLLPIPILMATDRPEFACLYLGLACAWLATEILRFGELPESGPDWQAKITAIGIAVNLNTGLFIAMGLAADVQTNFPFPLMAALSAVPAIGLVPWLQLRVRDQYAALILAGFLVGAAKLAGCVVARIVYGPNYIEAGYVAGDWRTAKLMITLFWTFTATMSLGLLVADYRRFRGEFARG